jgi:hypothetical protein
VEKKPCNGERTYEITLEKEIFSHGEEKLHEKKKQLRKVQVAPSERSLHSGEEQFFPPVWVSMEKCFPCKKKNCYRRCKLCLLKRG